MLQGTTSLTLVQGKFIDQIILSAIMQRVPNGQGTKLSLKGFVKGRYCLNSLISFYDKGMDVVYLDLTYVGHLFPQHVTGEFGW